MDRAADDTGSQDLLDSAAAGPAAIRGGAWRISGYLAGLLLAVVSSALMFRHFGLKDAGRYGVATNLIAIVAGLSDLGLTAVGVREFSVRDRRSRTRLARNLLGLRIVTSVAGVTAVTLFALGVGYGGTLAVGVVVAGVGLLLQSCQSTLAISLLADLRLAWVAGFDLVRAALTSILIVALVAAGARLVPFLAVSIPVGLVVLALNAWIVRGRIPVTPAFDPSEWCEVLRGALPYTIAVAAGTVYTQVAVIVVSLEAGGRATGYFTVSSRVIQLLLVLPGLAIGAALPIFARAARDGGARLAYGLGRTFEVALLLGVWVGLALGIGAPIAVTVYSSTFTHSVPLLAIQGVGLGASFVAAVWANGLLGLGRYRLILAINLLALVVGTALIAVLVELDGARGAAIATAGWEGVVALLSGAALVSADRTLMPPFGVVPKVAVAAGLAVVTTLFSLPVLLSVVVATVVYGAVTIGLGAVPADLMHAVRRPHA